MSETVRNKVLAALERYAEGGTMAEIRNDLKLKGRDFYRVLREEPALKEIYYQIQQDRADMMFDEAYQIGTDNDKDPKIARVQSDIRMKIGAAFDRKRFGDKIGVEIEAGPNLADALAAAKRRAPLPIRDLAQVTDAEYSALPAVPIQDATDNESAGVSSGHTEAPASDPLGLFDDE